MADQKITELDELNATPDNTDLVAIVDDVAGTPVTKKITIANLLAGSSGTVENISSQCNGSTTIFTTTSNKGIIWLTLNGTMLIEGKEFTRDSATQITLTFAPNTGEELYLKYI